MTLTLGIAITALVLSCLAFAGVATAGVLLARKLQRLREWAAKR